MSQAPGNPVSQSNMWKWVVYKEVYFGFDSGGWEVQEHVTLHTRTHTLTYTPIHSLCPLKFPGFMPFLETTVEWTCRV